VALKPNWYLPKGILGIAKLPPLSAEENSNTLAVSAGKASVMVAKLMGLVPSERLPDISPVFWACTKGCKQKKARKSNSILFFNYTQVIVKCKDL
jgi:hypothetical protein